MGGLRRVRLAGWQRVVVVAGLVALLVAGGSVAATAKVRGASDEILAGVKVGGVDVGGMTRDQAVAAVEARTKRTLDRRVVMVGGGRRWTVTPAGLGRDAAVGQAVDRAMNGPNLSFVADTWHRLTDRPVSLDVPVRYSDDAGRVTQFLRELAPKLAVEPTDASIRLVDGAVVKTRAKDGRALDVAASAKAVTKALRSSSRRSVRLVTHTVDPKVPESRLGKTITVNISTNTLTLYDGMKVERTYGVATAKGGFVTPQGSWTVINKVMNPTWVNPAPDTWGKDDPPMIPPGPGNPLGTRALYLNAPGIRIHGTYASSSVGSYASHGCIRMRIPDSEALYPLVPVGTPVLVHR